MGWPTLPLVPQNRILALDLALGQTVNFILSLRRFFHYPIENTEPYQNSNAVSEGYGQADYEGASPAITLQEPLPFPFTGLLLPVPSEATNLITRNACCKKTSAPHMSRFYKGSVNQPCVPHLLQHT